MGVLMLSVGIVLLCILSTLTPQILILLLILPILFVTFNGNVYGLLWAGRISRAIAREQEMRTFDTLSLTPYGALGASWALCAGCVHRDYRFSRLQTISTEELFIALLVAVVLSVERTTQSWMFSENMIFTQVLLILTYTTILLVGFYVNHVQSVVLGALIGMQVPTFVHNRFDGQIWSVGLYLVLQAVTYGMTFVVSVVLLPAIVMALNVAGLANELLLAFLSLGIFYGIRETVVAVLWRMLIYQLNGNSSEFESMSYFRVRL
jgi:hypothetical protein